MTKPLEAGGPPKAYIFRDGANTDPEYLRYSILKVMAGHLCNHTESKARACGGCRDIANKLLEPVCRFAYRAAMGNRQDSAVGQGDGYASLGAALELFFKDCEIPFDGREASTTKGNGSSPRRSESERQPSSAPVEHPGPVRSDRLAGHSDSGLSGEQQQAGTQSDTETQLSVRPSGD